MADKDRPDKPKLPISNPLSVRDPTGRHRIETPRYGPNGQANSWFARLARRARHARAILTLSVALVAATTGFLLYFAPQWQVNKHAETLREHDRRIGAAEVEVKYTHEDLHWLRDQTYVNARSSGAPVIPLPVHPTDAGAHSVPPANPTPP